MAAGDHGTTFSLNYLLCGQMVAKSTPSEAPLLSGEHGFGGLSSSPLGADGPRFRGLFNRFLDMLLFESHLISLRPQLLHV